MAVKLVDFFDNHIAEAFIFGALVDYLAWSFITSENAVNSTKHGKNSMVFIDVPYPFN